MREKLFQWKMKRLRKRGERYRREYEFKKAYAKYLPERKKRKVSNMLLLVAVIAIIAYTVANIWVTYTTGTTIDPTLTTCFYAFWTSEIFALMGIKLSKVKSNYDNTSCDESYFVEDEVESLEDEDVCG